MQGDITERYNRTRQGTNTTLNYRQGVVYILGMDFNFWSQQDHTCIEFDYLVLASVEWSLPDKAWNIDYFNNGKSYFSLTQIWDWTVLLKVIKAIHLGIKSKNSFLLFYYTHLHLHLRVPKQKQNSMKHDTSEMRFTNELSRFHCFLQVK